MTSLAWLIPAALALGALGLVAFLWSLNSGQFDDLEGASWRAIDDEVPRAKRPVNAAAAPAVPKGEAAP